MIEAHQLPNAIHVFFPRLLSQRVRLFIEWLSSTLDNSHFSLSCMLHDTYMYYLFTKYHILVKKCQCCKINDFSSWLLCIHFTTLGWKRNTMMTTHQSNINLTQVWRVYSMHNIHIYYNFTSFYENVILSLHQTCIVSGTCFTYHSVA